MKKNRLIAALLVCAMVLTLVACGTTSEDEPTKSKNPKKVTELAMVVDENTISQLDDYPYLQKVDLTGSTCYAAMAAYAKAHPDIEVIYTVSVGSSSIALGEAAGVAAALSVKQNKLLRDVDVREIQERVGE